MSPGALFLVLAAFLLAGAVPAAIRADASATRPLPPSNITVIGTVFCDICSNNTFSEHSYFLRGARVRVDCSFRSNSTAKEEITISVERTTDRFGVYRVDVPPVDGFECKEGRQIESFCRASLVGSSSALCAVPGLSISTEHLAIRCTEANLCVYNLNALNFRPPKRDLALCGAAPAAETEQSFTKSPADSALFFWPPFPPFGFHWPFPHWPPFPFPFPFPSPSSSFPFPFPFPSPSSSFPFPFSPPPTFPFPFPSPPPSFPFPFPSPPPSFPFPFPSPPPSFPIPLVPSPSPPPFSFPLPPSWFPPSPPPPVFPFPLPPSLFPPSPPPPASFPFPFPPFPPLSPAPFVFTPSPPPPSPPPPFFPFPPFPPNPFAPAPPPPSPPPSPHFSLRDPRTWFPFHPPSPPYEPRTGRRP